MVPLGQRLHNARVARKLTLEEIAATIKIKPQFLAAIERGEYHKLPSPAYAQGFVKNYASFLGFPKSEVTALFRREFDARKAYKVLPDSFAKRQDFPGRRIRMQQSLLVVVVIFIFFLAYLGYQYRSFYLPPSLTVNTLKQSAQEVVISGRTDSNATVSINNQIVPLNASGAFSKTLTLFPGKTVITVIARNRLGKETIIQKTIEMQ